MRSTSMLPGTSTRTRVVRWATLMASLSASAALALTPPSQLRPQLQVPPTTSAATRRMVRRREQGRARTVRAAASASVPEDETGQFWKLQGHPGLRKIHSDPDVFLIDDFIDPSYCEQLIDSALAGGGTDDTTMRQSTAPAPQLDAGALWPLAPIVLLSAVPSALHAVEDGSNVLAACVRAWGVAASLVAGLAAAAPRVMAMATPESRTSSSALLGDRRLTDELVQKASELVGASELTFEAPVVTQYTEGQRFLAHNDASLQPELDWADTGGQRLVTMIHYLNDVPQGGRTVFNNLKGEDGLPLAVVPKAGRVLVFLPATADGKVDERTMHQAEEAVDVKFVCQMWKRQRTVPPPLGVTPL